MEGIIGQFFYAFGLTVVFATLFSIFISFTLAPLLAARLLRTNETELEETKAGSRPSGAAGTRATVAGAALPRRPGLGAGPAPQRLDRHRVDLPPLDRLPVHRGPLRGRRVHPQRRRGRHPRGARAALGHAHRPAPPRWPRWRSDARGGPGRGAMLTTISGAGGDLIRIGGGANVATILVTLRDDGRTPTRCSATPTAPGRPAGRADHRGAVRSGRGGPGGQAPIQILVISGRTTPSWDSSRSA
jgi:hypothetical protein